MKKILMFAAALAALAIGVGCGRGRVADQPPDHVTKNGIAACDEDKTYYDRCPSQPGAQVVGTWFSDCTNIGSTGHTSLFHEDNVYGNCPNHTGCRAGTWDCCNHVVTCLAGFCPGTC